MKKKLSTIFTILALILSHIMCIVVAYNYASLLWCGKYGLCSAPASVAFIYVIPFGISIMICAVLAVIFKRKG